MRLIIISIIIYILVYTGTGQTYLNELPGIVFNFLQEIF